MSIYYVYLCFASSKGAKKSTKYVKAQSNKTIFKTAKNLYGFCKIADSTNRFNFYINGLPLSAETNQRYRKFMILDTGIYQRFLRLDLTNLLLDEKIEQINKGALAEMFVGIELVKSQNNRLPAELYYWQREKAGAAAEIDYVIQQGQNIVPVEVKAGTKGAMQSMFLFLAEKQRHYGIRCSMENFGEFQNIKIYPLYAEGKII